MNGNMSLLRNNAKQPTQKLGARTTYTVLLPCYCDPMLATRLRHCLMVAAELITSLPCRFEFLLVLILSFIRLGGWG